MGHFVPAIARRSGVRIWTKSDVVFQSCEGLLGGERARQLVSIVVPKFTPKTCQMVQKLVDYGDGWTALINCPKSRLRDIHLLYDSEVIIPSCRRRDHLRLEHISAIIFYHYVHVEWNEQKISLC